MSLCTARSLGFAMPFPNKIIPHLAKAYIRMGKVPIALDEAHSESATLIASFYNFDSLSHDQV
jgi:hypothetical protein